SIKNHTLLFSAPCHWPPLLNGREIVPENSCDFSIMFLNEEISKYQFLYANCVKIQQIEFPSPPQKISVKHRIKRNVFDQRVNERGLCKSFIGTPGCSAQDHYSSVEWAALSCVQETGDLMTRFLRATSSRVIEKIVNQRFRHGCLF